MNDAVYATTPEKCAVLTHQLGKRYGAERALDDVNLRIPEGAVYALLGTNGSGKSTTIKVLLNLEAPDHGNARVFGFDTVQDGPTVRAQIGYVPESHDAGYRWMTCERLMTHIAAYHQTWDAAYAKHLVDAFELRVSRKVGGLSKGETRRLQLLLALAHRPPLLLLDEPTDGLDPIVRRRTLQILAEHLADTPTTVLLSTHQIHEVESLVDHVGILRRGTLVHQLSRDELQRRVKVYRLRVPDAWSAPASISIAEIRRAPSSRVAQLTAIGDEHDVTERIILSGAEIEQCSALSLENATMALLGNAASS